MICISPMAPFAETACASPPLLTRITARNQETGTSNRAAASVTNGSNGSAVWTPFATAAGHAPSACSADAGASSVARIVAVERAVDPEHHKRLVAAPAERTTAGKRVEIRFERRCGLQGGRWFPCIVSGPSRSREARLARRS